MGLTQSDESRCERLSESETLPASSTAGLEGGSICAVIAPKKWILPQHARAGKQMLPLWSLQIRTQSDRGLHLNFVRRWADSPAAPSSSPRTLGESVCIIEAIQFVVALNAGVESKHNSELDRTGFRCLPTEGRHGALRFLGDPCTIFYVLVWNSGYTS
jgi:hypothetical protein